MGARARVLESLTSHIIKGQSANGGDWVLRLDPSEGAVSPARFTNSAAVTTEGAFLVQSNNLCQSYDNAATWVCHQIQDCKDLSGLPFLLNEAGLQTSQILSTVSFSPEGQLCAEPGRGYNRERLDSLVRGHMMVMRTQEGTSLTHVFMPDGTGASHPEASLPEQMQWKINFARLCTEFPSETLCMTIRDCASGEGRYLVLGNIGNQVGLVAEFLDLDGRPLVKATADTTPAKQSTPAMSSREHQAAMECAAIESALARLDCYDALFGGTATQLETVLPNTNRLRADLLGLRLLDPNNNALGVGRRYFDVGSLSQFMSTQILNTTQEGDVAEIAFRVVLRPNSSSTYYQTVVNMVYRRKAPDWVLQNIAMMENFTLTEGR